MTYEEFITSKAKYNKTRFALIATSEYMEFLCSKLAKMGQLWAWGNIGDYQKKSLWRIN